MRATTTVAALALVAGLTLAGCHGAQSALDAAGPQSERIGTLFWTFSGIGSLVWATTVGFLLVGLFRRRPRPRSDATPITHPEPATENRLRNGVVVAVGATTIILFGLLFADFLTGRRMHAIPSEDPLTIRVTGRQWWWEVTYQHPIPSQTFTTANEIHVPVGRPVRFQLESSDVIHSFWIPTLHGKKDLVPGYPTTTWFMASRAGRYIGQCAEFCGHQHARMRLDVIAEAPEQFARWVKSQQRPGRPPVTATEKRGQAVFLGGTCLMCHRIAGTPAGATVGPDLTHVASRPRLAAGTIPNTRGHLAAWILDPHGIKPGVRMPPNQFTGQELQDLLDYLQSLK